MTLSTLAVAVALAAGPALASIGGSYKGRTSQHKAVTITVAGKLIKDFVIVWNARCPGGTVGPLSTFHRSVPLDAHGRWHAAGTYPAGPFKGVSELFTVRDHGAFTGHRQGQGVFTGSVRVYRAGKHPKYLYSCTSGKITFRFKHVA